MGPTHVWLAHLYVKGVFLGWNIKSTSLKLAQGMHGKRLKYHGPIVAPLWEQPAWNERATSGRTKPIEARRSLLPSNKARATPLGALWITARFRICGRFLHIAAPAPFLRRFQLACLKGHCQVFQGKSARSRSAKTHPSLRIYMCKRSGSCRSLAAKF